MNKEIIRFNVFFEEPFWVGICEKVDGGKLSACKITFGAEPKDYMVENFILMNWYRLCFSPTVNEDSAIKEKINPKRMHKAINKHLQTLGTGTKSQQALKLLQEQGKTARKDRKRVQKEEETTRQYELKQQKKKDKHRGR